MRIRTSGAAPFARARYLAVLATLGLLAAVLAACVPDRGMGTREPPAGAATIVLGADRDYPPFTFQDDAGEPTGFDVELFGHVARRAGFRPRVELGDWDVIQARLEAGQVHVAAMLVSEQRMKRFRFSRPFLHRHHLVFGRAGAGYVAGLDRLAGRRVAVQSGGLAWEELRRQPGVRIVEVEVEGGALQAVHEGRADYAVTPSFIGLEAIRRHELRGVVALSPPLLEREYAFAVSPRHAHLVARIDRGLEDATRAGIPDALYLKWLANLTPPTEPYRSGLTVGLAIALVLFVVTVLMWMRWLLARRAADGEALSRSRAEARALQAERYDPVTRLANRAALIENLQPLIDRGEPFALVKFELLELDTIQALAGHDFTEELLQRIAGRLRELSGREMPARLGAARFALAFPGTAGERDVRADMQALQQSVRQRIEIGHVPIELTSRAGAALFPAHGRTGGELLRNAGIALTEAYAQGSACVVYDASLEPDPRNLTLLADLSDAMRQGTLGYALQPKLDLGSHRVVGAELLVRWQHARYGAVSPAEFVPLAEKTELIGEMTVYLVRRAVALLARWGDGSALHIAVNMSANDLADASVVERIVQACDGRTGRLILEVTETAVMRDSERSLASIERLRAHGLRVALDDFGTGNASLTYLRQMQPDEVKIDRSFTSGVLHSAADQAIVRSTIDLAHALGATVTAEGVEDEDTLDWLAASGCDRAQGYLIARPMPLERFEQFVREGTARERAEARS